MMPKREGRPRTSLKEEAVQGSMSWKSDRFLSCDDTRARSFLSARQKTPNYGISSFNSTTMSYGSKESHSNSAN